MGRSIRLFSLPALLVLVSACVGREFTASPSGSGGSGSTTSGPGGGGGGGGGMDSECPKGLAGPELVKVPEPAGGAYCIDKTEVTNRQYQDWLDMMPSISGQDPVCAWNDNFETASSGGNDVPVEHVDWCDARAYCAAAGKRLCGRIGGGASPFASAADAALSQWYNACSAGGTKVFPYGDDYLGGHCVTWDYNMTAGPDGGDAPQPVAAAFKCNGGYPGLFDMSGNVYEWEDSCEGVAGEADACRIRGGGYVEGAGPARCDADTTQPRSVTANGLGFRCCYDL